MAEDIEDAVQDVTIIILSSSLIAQIAESYFNKIMFKGRVQVVDLRPSGDNGYAFSLAFLPKVIRAKDETHTVINGVPKKMPVKSHEQERDNTGKFVRKG